MSLLVGLTGGIGSGKSLAASIFKSLDAYIIDADQLCKNLVEPGQIALKEIVQCFGESILDKTGHLNRKKLANIIFQSSEKKTILEGILHPKIVEIEQRQYSNICRQDVSAIVIVDAALLIESGNYKNMDKVIVVRSTPKTQVQRIVKRNSFTIDEAQSRIDNQLSYEEKAKYADFILDNDSTEIDLKRNVIALHSKLINISNSSEIQ